MTLAENTKYINIPPTQVGEGGLQVVNNATMRVYLTILHPMDSPEFYGDPRRTLPLAIVTIGEFLAIADTNQTPSPLWIPTEADLTDAGKFLVSVLLDAYPQHGKHYLSSTLIMHEWDELPVEALQELMLTAAPVENQSIN
jgi:hypothetical protein